MNKLGFVKQDPSLRVRPTDFFEINTAHFLKMFCLNPVRTKCNIQTMDNIDFEIDVEKTLIPAQCGDGLYLKGDVVNIRMSFQLIRALNEGDPDLRIERYWCYFAKFMHLWSIRQCNVPINQLVPAKVLIEMPDTEDIVSSFGELFDNYIWTPLDLAQNYAAAAVGIHVAEIMSSEESVINVIQPAEIGEIIFHARAHNWSKFTARH